MVQKSIRMTGDEEMGELSSPVCYADKKGSGYMPPKEKTVTKDPEVFLVPADLHQVSCKGKGGGLGHPKVYYTFDGQDAVTCGYCDRVFTKTPVAGAKPYKGAA